MVSALFPAKKAILHKLNDVLSNVGFSVSLVSDESEGSALIGHMLKSRSDLVCRGSKTVKCGINTCPSK